MLVAAGFFFAWRGAWIAAADRAGGEVVSLMPSGRGYSPSVVFLPDGADAPVRFTVGWSTDPPLYAVGDNVPVLYQRDNPAAAAIDVHLGLWWPAYVLAGIGAVFCLLASLAGLRATAQPRS